MYPRGQSHLEGDPTHLLGYWSMPTAELLGVKDLHLGKWSWAHGWSLVILVSSKGWECGLWLLCAGSDKKAKTQQWNPYLNTNPVECTTQQAVLLAGSSCNSCLLEFLSLLLRVGFIFQIEPDQLLFSNNGIKPGAAFSKSLLLFKPEPCSGLLPVFPPKWWGKSKLPLWAWVSGKHLECLFSSFCEYILQGFRFPVVPVPPAPPFFFYPIHLRGRGKKGSDVGTLWRMCLSKLWFFSLPGTLIIWSWFSEPIVSPRPNP